MSIRRPDFAAVDRPFVAGPRCARAHAGEIGSTVGFAHPDRAKTFAARDRRQQALLLLFRTEFQKLGSGLPIGDPMGRRRCARREQLLDYHVALERAALGAAVALRPRHSDKARAAEPSAEGSVEMAP